MEDSIPSDAFRALSTYIREKSPELSATCQSIYEKSKTLKAMREFSIYPYLFCPDLGIDNELTFILSQMYVCLTLFFRIQDCAVDQPTRNNTQHLLFTNVLLGYLLNLLHHFPSKIFDILERTFIEYSTSSTYEIETYSFCRDTFIDPTKLDFNDISFLGKKFSPLKIPLAAALLHSDKGTLHVIDSLINTYGIALQLRNDIIDWEEDYERGQMTYFLSEVIKTSFSHEHRWPEVHEIKRAILFSDVLMRMMTLELQYMIEAKNISQEISLQFSKFFENRVKQLKRDIEELIIWKYHHSKTGFITP
jgi:hypothetical protein